MSRIKDIDLKKSMKYHARIKHLTKLFLSKKAELATSYQGYHELLGFIDQIQYWGITDRGQEKALDKWIDLLERWPFEGGTHTGPLPNIQRHRTMTRDGFVCTICGQPAEEVHHKMSRSKGGKNRTDNLTSLCVKCHEKVHGVRYSPGKK
ncbi:MAG: HNH endonuclease [ANME-2 cluster archaeon]|nr:HNH endonuclease [ANME-2 cluster archaeon]